MIEGNRRIADDPSPEAGFVLQIIWFRPTRDGSRPELVQYARTVRRRLELYRDHERLFVSLVRDGGKAGSVYVHVAGGRAWVTHFTQPGGIDSYCRDPNYAGPDEMVGFLLDNGQLDEIHRSWTVPRADGTRALEYFLLHGGRDPRLDWVEQPPSLQGLSITNKSAL
jgi:hypothetical protein